MAKKFKLRDIVANHVGEPDIAYLQRKISAASEMKSAIKRTLVGVNLDDPDLLPHNVVHVLAGDLIGLRTVMEGYLNVV